MKLLGYILQQRKVLVPLLALLTPFLLRYLDEAAAKVVQEHLIEAVLALGVAIAAWDGVKGVRKVNGHNPRIVATQGSRRAP